MGDFMVFAARLRGVLRRRRSTCVAPRMHRGALWFPAQPIVIAPLGQVSAHALQSMQSSALTTATVSGTVIACDGQASTQVLQALHFSLSTIAAMKNHSYKINNSGPFGLGRRLKQNRIASISDQASERGIQDAQAASDDGRGTTERQIRCCVARTAGSGGSAAAILCITRGQSTGWVSRGRRRQGSLFGQTPMG